MHTSILYCDNDDDYCYLYRGFDDVDDSSICHIPYTPTTIALSVVFWDKDDKSPISKAVVFKAQPPGS